MSVNQLHDSPSKLVFTDQLAMEAFLWWSQMSHLQEGQSLVPFLPDLEIHTDASLQGWGACLDRQTISGVWSPLENRHFNLLEMQF